MVRAETTAQGVLSNVLEDVIFTDGLSVHDERLAITNIMQANTNLSFRHIGRAEDKRVSYYEVYNLLDQLFLGTIVITTGGFGVSKFIYEGKALMYILQNRSRKNKEPKLLIRKGGKKSCLESVSSAEVDTNLE